MQVVIEIDEEIYNMVMNTGTFGCYRFNTAKAIKNGTPLPKGHGNLKDEDEIFDAFEVAIHYANKDGHEYANAFESNGRWCAEYDSIKSMIESAKTIIEADKESEWT